MSDQGDHSDIEEEKLLGKDESDAGDRDESSSRVVPSDSAPMTRGDFQIMTKQNERIMIINDGRIRTLLLLNDLPK